MILKIFDYINLYNFIIIRSIHFTRFIFPDLFFFFFCLDQFYDIYKTQSLETLNSEIVCIVRNLVENISVSSHQAKILTKRTKSFQLVNNISLCHYFLSFLKNSLFKLDNFFAPFLVTKCLRILGEPKVEEQEKIQETKARGKKEIKNKRKWIMEEEPKGKKN